jgi:hypothetical protein
MNCGSGDFACWLLSLIAEHGGEASHALKWLPWMQDAVREHIQAIIGLAGLSFGIWKWWYFREQVLHKRLAEYLESEDHRLTQARHEVLEAINRPGPRRSFAEPLFAVKPLQKVLRKKNWDRVVGAPGIEIGAEKQLAAALKTLTRRLEVAREQLDQLHAQQATAYLMRGAIASARAGEALYNGSAVRLDRKALNEFRSLLQVPGHEDDIEAREYEAHQLRRLGLHQQALDAYQQVEEIAQTIDTDTKLRDLTVARSKRWRAALVQAKAWQDFEAGARQGAGSGTAYDLLKANEDSALKLRNRHGPFLAGWDAIEQGDLHYLTAFVAQNLSFSTAARVHLGLAETAYQSVITATHPLAPIFSRGARRLEATAQSAMKRIRRAQASPDDYDRDWLLPSIRPLEPPHQPAQTVGANACDQAVSDAPNNGGVE